MLYSVVFIVRVIFALHMSFRTNVFFFPFRRISLNLSHTVYEEVLINTYISQIMFLMHIFSC